MRLSELTTGHEAVILSVTGAGAFRKRIIEMGFVRGKRVRAIKNAPLNDPIEYKIMDYYVSLRREEAEMITIVAVDSEEAKQALTTAYAADDLGPFEQEDTHERRIRAALVGNPNCGKTTLFNAISGRNEHTGNYSGVTVGASSVVFKKGGYTIELIDLPGTYSISAYSPEETFVREKLLELDPDIVINVVDAGNLARNLYLTTQLIDMGQRVVMALNMYDDFERSGDTLDYLRLGGMLGIPMIPTVGAKARGIDSLVGKIIQVYEAADPLIRRIRINYGRAIEDTLTQMVDLMDKEAHLAPTVLPRYLAIKVLENDMDFAWAHLRANDQAAVIARLVEMRTALLNSLSRTELETYITDLRYGFIDGALSETMRSQRTNDKPSRSQRIDRILTNRYVGIPIFIVFIWLMFQCTFALGQYPMDWIEALVSWIGETLSDILPSGPVRDLLVDGIIQGVGGVIVYLPNILILFLFISFMEDTGYMARAAFIMDKLMHKMGLHGKSFIPLIMGFGCNVPAIMATRTIEDRNNRLLTMLINPFMSCSARLPVYLLFCAAFFPNCAGTAMFLIYLTGIVVAIVACRIYKHFLIKSQELPFVMELPPYRMPTMRSTLLNMWSKASQYLSKMGGIIMVASIIIWFLGYYPQNEHFDEAMTTEVTQVEQMGLDEATTALMTDSITHRYAMLKSENSFIGMIGKAIEPAIAPLGFDWKMGVSLVAGVAAKEIVVSSLAVLYRSDADDEESLARSLVAEKHGQQPAFNQANAMAFMVFTLLYFPCMATLVAIKNEAAHWNDFNLSQQRRRKNKNAWRWAIYVAVANTIIAWILAWLTYTVMSYVIG